MADYKPGALAAESQQKAYKPGALAAESKAKKEIPLPDPGLSTWEKFTGGLSDLAGSALHEASRFSSGINAAVNSLTRPEPIQPGLQGFLGELERASQKSGEAFYAPEQTPLQMFRQRTNEKSGMPAKVGAFLGDLVGGMALDPLNGPIDRLGAAAAGVIKAGAKVVAATRGGQKAIQVAQRVVDPVMNSKLGAEGQRLLLWLGTGPYQRMFRETMKDYKAEVGYEVQKVATTVDDIARETRRAQGASRVFRDNMEQYAAKAGDHPIVSLVRRAVKDRSAGRTPLNQLNPQQLAATLKRYDNPFGVKPEFIIGKADEILGHIDETEKLLLKSGKSQAINKGGAHTPLVDPETWLNQMFGAEKAKPQTIAQALLGKAEGGTAQIQEIHEAGIRTFLNDLPKHSEWVQPVTAGLKPGWVPVPAGGLLGSKLAGLQMPAPLYNALEVELSKAGQIPAKQIRSEYIIAFDAAQWWQKKVVGTVKKGLIGSPATQAANIVGNQFVMNKALARAGISAGPLEIGKVLKESFNEAMQMGKGIRTNAVDRLSRYSPSLLTTQIESSIGDPAGALGQLDKVKYIPGTNLNFAVPKPSGMTARLLGEGKLGETAATIGAAADKINPANAVANFQNVAEKAYKLATFKMLAKKLGDKEAAALTEKYLFDYSDRGVLLEAADRFGLAIFNAFPTKAFGLFMDEVIHNPAELVKYKRLQNLALAGQNTAGLEQVNERYKTPFTVPIDDQGNVLDLQRFNPFGAPLEGISDVFSGKSNPVQALPAMFGLGRAGENPSESVMNAPLLSRLRDTVRGISSYSEAGEVKPLLAEGQPSNELGGLQRREAWKNYAPSMLGGRGYQGVADALQGKTATDYPNQESRDLVSVLMQHGLGLRTFPALTDAQRNTKFEGVREKRAAVVDPEWTKAYEMAGKAIKNPHTEEVSKLTPGQAGAKANKTQQYVQNLAQSPSVVDKSGKITKEGRMRIRNAALYLVALEKRAEEE